jgi:CPA1 family monovalent cation:H+ antiporter
MLLVLHSRSFIMDVFVVIALLVIISAVYSYINNRFIKMPATIGIVCIATVVSVVILIVNKSNPGVAGYITKLSKNIDFSRSLLNIMLGFMLFAGSFNLDTNKLKKEMRPVFVLSTVGVILSTVIFGGLFYGVTLLLHIKLPLLYCLLFGAVVSPTDPVAVAAIVNGSKLPQHLETIISGESLFNDGIGLVLFIILIELTTQYKPEVDFMKAAVLFIREVFGGVALGVVMGFLTFRLMRSVSDFQTIVLLSLALVMSISVIATFFHLSIPLAVVSAGLFTGSRSINLDSKEQSHEALEKFWRLIDELLNTILFVMIGLQMVNLPFLNNYWLTGGIAILLILIARWASITLPLTFLRRSLNINYNNVSILTWAGLRGGISIALALSLPHTPYREIILSGSYFIVIFSIIVQGLTLNRVINRIYSK